MDTSEISNLESWAYTLLADPITKTTTESNKFPLVRNIIDARVFLKNTCGYVEWSDGQDEYESYVENDKIDTTGYQKEITYDRPVYEHFQMDGIILDVGGGVGTLREFLPNTAKYISIDPYIYSPQNIPSARKNAYSCLSKPLNFIGACAEFLPFLTESFDWIHMRSMLDHVQIPDLALLEAKRVLKPNGRILIGLYVEGGKSGHINIKQRIKESIKKLLEIIGISYWKDHHIWHPTFKGLIKIIESNELVIEDIYWQPYWNEQVCYISAKKV